MPARIIKSGLKRYAIYIIAAVVFVAAIITTLISFDLFTMEDTKEWIGTLVAIVALIYGLGQSILAALNISASEEQLLEMPEE